MEINLNDHLTNIADLPTEFLVDVVKELYRRRANEVSVEAQTEAQKQTIEFTREFEAARKESQSKCTHIKQNGRAALVGQYVPTEADPTSMVLVCQKCQQTFTDKTVPAHVRVSLDGQMFGGVHTPWLDYNEKYPWRRAYSECGEYPIPVIKNGVVVDYIYEPDKWYSRYVRRYQYAKVVLTNAWKIMKAVLRDL